MVYPRVCGGTSWPGRSTPTGQGLSPRVRGNQWRLNAKLGMKGSIPACAGEPVAAERQTGNERVYPRVCGGTQPNRGHTYKREGLSPRVRGNRRTRGFPHTTHGSIPACAGEPIPACAGEPNQEVYPRVCGGTIPACAGEPRMIGLSPRVRGNPSPAIMRRPASRSIPACAGEPYSPDGKPKAARVYPRVCGGTRRHTPASPGT